MTSQRYDVVIVGAGSAGAVLAARLSEDPACSVALIEAGPDYPDVASLPDDIRLGNNFLTAVWGKHCRRYTATANEHQPQPAIIPRGVVTGGSSAINPQIFLRGLPEDYDAWARSGNDHWSFEKVLPYFIKSEKDLDFDGPHHGSSGNIPVRRLKRESWSGPSKAFYDACRAAGIPEDPDANHPQSTGVGPRPLNNVDGVRISTAIAYLNGARGRPNLTIIPDALARRIVFEGKRAVGVEVERGAGVSRVDGRRIVLCGGAIQSPQLLLLSGVGPAEDLRRLGIAVKADLPGVGRNLKDHPAVALLFQGKGAAPGPDVHCWQVGLRYTTPDSQDRNDMLFNLFLIPRGNPMQTIQHARKRLRLSYLEILKCGLRRGRAFFTISCCLQNPQAAGELKLVSVDPRQQPTLNYRYLASGRDRERMRHGVRLIAKLAKEPAFQAGIDAPIVFPSEEVLASDALLDRWTLLNVNTQQHTCGTCKMGPASDPLAVVDQFGNVHGVDGLAVMDASVMPDIVRANINATVVMMAERSADWLRTASAA